MSKILKKEARIIKRKKFDIRKQLKVSINN